MGSRQPCCCLSHVLNAAGWIANCSRVLLARLLLRPPVITWAAAGLGWSAGLLLLLTAAAAAAWRRWRAASRDSRGRSGPSDGWKPTHWWGRRAAVAPVGLWGGQWAVVGRAGVKVVAWVVRGVLILHWCIARLDAPFTPLARTRSASSSGRRDRPPPVGASRGSAAVRIAVVGAAAKCCVLASEREVEASLLTRRFNLPRRLCFCVCAWMDGCDRMSTGGESWGCVEGAIKS